MNLKQCQGCFYVFEMGEFSPVVFLGDPEVGGQRTPDELARFRVLERVRHVRRPRGVREEDVGFSFRRSSFRSTQTTYLEPFIVAENLAFMQNHLRGDDMYVRVIH
jgi:hypothetical protein